VLGLAAQLHPELKLVDLVLSVMALLVPDTIGCFGALVEVPFQKLPVLLSLHLVRKVLLIHVAVVLEDRVVV
jgi:hypothetical protein